MSKRFVLIMAVALILAVATVWFGYERSKDKSNQPGQSAQTKVSPNQRLKVGYIPISDAAQLYIASQTGLFDKQGLTVDLVPLEGGAAILQALSSGSLDVGFSNLASVVFFQRNSGPLVRLSGGTLMDQQHSEAGLVVLSDSGINSPADLKGKTVAVNALKNIVDLAVVKLVRDAGIEPTEVRRIEIPFKDMEAALRAHRVDAAALPEPILTRAIGSGGLRNLGDHFVLAYGSLYSTGYFTTPSNYQNNPGVYAKFNAAIEEATPLANSFGRAAATAVSSVTKIPPELLSRSGRALFVAKLPEDAVVKMESLMKKEKFLE